MYICSTICHACIATYVHSCIQGHFIVMDATSIWKQQYFKQLVAYKYGLIYIYSLLHIKALIALLEYIIVCAYNI